VSGAASVMPDPEGGWSCGHALRRGGARKLHGVEVPHPTCPRQTVTCPSDKRIRNPLLAVLRATHLRMVPDAVAQFLHRPCNLVTRHHRVLRKRERPFLHHKISVAYAACPDTDQYLTRSGLRGCVVLGGERGVRLLKHHCLHGVLPLFVVACVVTRSIGIILAEASKIRELNKGLNSEIPCNALAAHVHQQNGDARVRASRPDCSRYVRLPVGVPQAAVDSCSLRCSEQDRHGSRRSIREGHETTIEGYVLPRRSMSG
jgi:hypothetical protein